MALFVPYNPGSAVQMANQMAAGLTDQGAELILMSQGAEETEPSDEHFQREVLVRFSGGYQKAAGGQQAQREITAQFLNEFCGYQIATAQNTFLGFQNGRSGLGKSFKIAAAPFVRAQIAAAMLVGALSWPMIAGLAKEEYIDTHYEYALEQDGLGDALAATITAEHLDEINPSNPMVAALYTNYPNNPTGLHGTQNEIVAAQTILDGLNTQRVNSDLPKILHIADNPYFMSAPALIAGQNRLKSAYDSVFTRNGATPTIIDTSFAKALAMATPGVHAMTFTDDEMAAAYERSSKQTTAFSYFPEAMAAVVASIHPNMYPHLREHFAYMAEKYARNHSIVRNHLGQHLLPGDPGMVCTVRVPQTSLNKVVEINDQRVEVKTGRDVAAVAANQFNVVTVDQSVTKGDRHDPLLRLALKSEDEKKIAAGSRGVADTFEMLEAAPDLAA